MPLATLTRRLRALAEPVRLRILALLEARELTVKELTEILNLGQSRVSAHLARLVEEGLVVSRREGRCSLYTCAATGGPALAVVLEDFRATPEAARDRAGLEAALARREQGPPPGSLGPDYLPGRTWEGFAKGLLAVLPPLRIADLGIGRGDLTLLLARGGGGVVAVDNDPDVLGSARRRARRAGLRNIVFREGDLADPPIARGEVELWVLSQVLHLVPDPAAALRAARELLAAGGRVLVLDLLAHQESWVRERLGHQHAGFGEQQLRTLLDEAGFVDVHVERVARDRKPPHFVTVLGTGRTPADE